MLNFFFFQVIERIYRLEANHFLRKAMNIVITLTAVTCLLIVLVNITIGISTKNEIKNWENARYHHATVVFGAGVYQSGEISGVFMDRLKTASRLFHSGKTDLIIVSTSLDQPNEQELSYLESQIPELAEGAFKQVFLQTLADGEPVMMAENNQLVELFADGTKKVIRSLTSLSSTAEQEGGH